MAKADMHGSSENESKAWGKGEFANMPKEVKMNMYPKSHQFGPGMEDDTMTRVDAENSRAEMKSHKYLSNQH
jgi:hypothetical protein